MAAVVRFWNITDLTTFGGDQGYDFIQIRKMFTDQKPTLLGPKIGPYNKIGNLYLGPAYYYLLAPSLYFFKFDPLGPALLTAMFSIVTILLIYQTSKEFFSLQIALISSSIYSFSAFLINQSRAPSNPHLTPLFSVILLYSLLKITNKKEKSYIWLVLSGLSLGIMFQLHYLAAGLLISSVIFLFLSKKIKEILIIIVAFLAAISPQIIFELRHEFFVTNLFIEQLRSGNNVSGSGRFIRNFIESAKLLSSIISESKNLLSVFTILISAGFLIKAKNKKLKPALILLVLNLFFGLVITSIYSGDLGPHYFATIYVTACILISISISSVYETFKNLYARAILVCTFLILLSSNLLSLDLNSQEGYTMPKGQNLTGIRKTAKIIAGDVIPTTRFNIASTLDGDTRSMPYRYLVNVYGKTAQDVEKYPESEVIYLISKDEEDAIRRYTVWEVASFAPFDITNKWEVQNGILLYKLVKAKI